MYLDMDKTDTELAATLLALVCCERLPEIGKQLVAEACNSPLVVEEDMKRATGILTEAHKILGMLEKVAEGDARLFYVETTLRDRILKVFENASTRPLCANDINRVFQLGQVYIEAELGALLEEGLIVPSGPVNCYVLAPEKESQTE